MFLLETISSVINLPFSSLAFGNSLWEECGRVWKVLLRPSNAASRVYWDILMSLGRLKSTERSVDHGSLAHEVQRGLRTPSALGMGTIHVLCLVKNLVSCSSVPENPSEAEFEADGFPEGTCLGKYFPRVSTESFCC